MSSGGTEGADVNGAQGVKTFVIMCNTTNLAFITKGMGLTATVLGVPPHTAEETLPDGGALLHVMQFLFAPETPFGSYGWCIATPLKASDCI